MTKVKVTMKDNYVHNINRVDSYFMDEEYITLHIDDHDISFNRDDVKLIDIEEFTG